ncbi:MAG: hypothetical protein NTW19_11400 [Planctomycetota bacterium]|nr:hypothetical protein [Planctomycetota bacterium]
MQRNEDGGVVISCDFCGTDLDEILPMVEGHHGSVICLECVKLALEGLQAGGEAFSCPLCLQTQLAPETLHWSNPLRPKVTACKPCVFQAAGAFSKDPDVDWKWKR